MFKDPKKRYEIVRGAISKELANFIFNYLLLHRDATAHLIKYGVIQDKGQGNFFGTWKEALIPNTFSKYGDPVIETVLMKLLPVMRKITQRNLIPCYGYVRVYKKGDELVRHFDRESCETSCTLHLGGDPWKIFIDPSGACGVKKIISESKVIVKKKPNKGISLVMKPGDMLAYCGQVMEHWREPFKGNVHAQTFLHYNDQDGPHGVKNLYDGRAMIGLPKKGLRYDLDKWPFKYNYSQKGPPIQFK
jgi:hypothetical protein|tara:strand:+ start:61 stop:801 length:741 start_codon:yes stop_codon:yes gene_type:complete